MPPVRVALVTGAGSGIGRAAALALLTDGFHVVLAGRRRDRLEETATLGAGTGGGEDEPAGGAGAGGPGGGEGGGGGEDHAAAGTAEAGGRGRALVVPTDVRDPASVDALFGRTAEAFGRLDVLFNNAGVATPPTPLEDLSLEDWQAVVDVNLTGMFLCTRAAFRMMKAQDPRGGRIINNGSLSASVPRPDTAAYTATKHAVTGLTRATALEGRRHDIACGQIDVGNVATELSRSIVAGAVQADGTVAPEPRMEVEHVGRAVLQMARLPLDANILLLTIMATKMPFVGRG